MICFGAKTDQKVKENGTCGSHFKKTKQKDKKKWAQTEAVREVESKRDFLFFIFIFFSRFSLRYKEIGPSEFVGARTKVLYSMRVTHENQKHGISPSFQLKFGKSYVLVFLKSTFF